MLVLVVNAGSSSLKYQLRDTADGSRLAGGKVEVGGDGAADHATALARALDDLGPDARRIEAVGHRVVHGGGRFAGPTRITPATADAIEELAPLAPLHHPANAAGIRATRARWPDLPQAAVFDTDFHRTLPERARRYALPPELSDGHGIRRYGFHGSSHESVTGAAAAHLGVPRTELNAVLCHLGNGASATAVRGGASVDTSMGYTPLEGLVMGTRSGDLDPAAALRLVAAGHYTATELERLLNSGSGLLGVAGDADLRAVLDRADRGEADALVALELAAYRLAKYVGAYHVAVGGAAAVVFSGGIGENSPDFRHRVAAQLGPLGAVLDPEANAAAGSVRDRVAAISAAHSPVALLVVPTDEEEVIARRTAELLAADGPGAGAPPSVR